MKEHFEGWWGSLAVVISGTIGLGLWVFALRGFNARFIDAAYRSVFFPVATGISVTAGVGMLIYAVSRRRAKKETDPNAAVAVPATLFPNLKPKKLPAQSLIVALYIDPNIKTEHFDFAEQSIFKGFKFTEIIGSQTWARVLNCSDKTTGWPRKVSVIEIFCQSGADIESRVAQVISRVVPTRKQKLLSQWFSGRIPYQTKLRGIVVVLPISNASVLGKDTKIKLRHNINVIATECNCAAPVSVAFTHSEELCAEFFADFDAKANEPLGVVLSRKVLTAPADYLRQELERLDVRLADYRIILLKEGVKKAINATTKAAIYEFPYHFLSKIRELTDFLHSPGIVPTDGVFLRAVHFMTGSEEGGLSAQRYVKQVLFSDKLKAATSCSPKALYFWRGWFASMFVLTLMLLSFIMHSWYANKYLVAEVTQAQQVAVQAAAKVDQLDQLRTLIQRLQVGDLSWRISLVGFYQGDSLQKQIKDLYYNDFRSFALEPVLTGLKNGLDTVSVATPNLTYEVAREQLLVFNTIHFVRECRSVDPSLIASRLVDYWMASPYTQHEIAGRLAPHFQVFASEIAERSTSNSDEPLDKTNAEVIAKAQAYLKAIKGPDEVYREVTEDFDGKNTDVSVFEVLSDKGEQFRLKSTYNRLMKGPTSMKAAFVRQNVARVESEIGLGSISDNNETCLFAGSRLATQSTQAPPSSTEIALVKSKYRDAFIDSWKALLSGTDVVPFRGDLTDAADRLDQFSQSRSPILALFAFVADNTAPATSSTNSPPSDPVLLAEIGDNFRPIHHLLPPSSNPWRNSVNGSYLDALRGLAEALKDLARNPSDATAANRAQQRADEAATAVSRLTDSFGNNAGGLDIQIGRLLSAPIAQARLAIKVTPAPARP